MSVKVSCPGCAGPITFKIGSAMVAVCEFCRSVVARGDRQVENLGKVADLVETESVLAAGIKGRYLNVPFELTGRTQLRHQAGGIWDEWYAAFADGRWGWLAEGQGRFYLTFEKTTPAKVLPAFPDLQLGLALQLAGNLSGLKVAEIGVARPISAEGELPFRLEPGTSYHYADLSGPNGEFATLDYSGETPILFTGQEVTLDELGIAEQARREEPWGKQVKGVQLSCPQCAGPLELRAPDRSERVVCPNCGALLDVNQGNLKFLTALTQRKIKPIIPLGATGRLGDHQFINIGFMVRSIQNEGERFAWEEYLLYDRRVGFRWLVLSNDHWNIVEPLSPGKAATSFRGAVVSGEEFKKFQRGVASVDLVLGEFYWKVTVGERVEVVDYIRPPKILSREITRSDDDPAAGEINWSLGNYLEAAEVEKAFGVKDLTRPAWGNIAPNQVFPYKKIYAYWAILSLATLLVGMVLIITRPGKEVFSQTFAPEPQKEYFSDPFPLLSRRNLKIDVAAPALDNSWVGVEGTLIHEESDLTQPFGVVVDYYSGVDEGEKWSEGSRHSAEYLSPVPTGMYRLRLAFEGEPGHNLPEVNVKVTHGVHRLRNFLFALGILAAFPVCVLFYHIYFERKRWEDSDYSMFHSS